MNDDCPADDRDIRADDLSEWSIFHFALASAGFFLAIGGVVLSSVSTAMWGVAILVWGMAYFVAHNNDEY
jgi:hypothetical protein